MSRCPSAGKTGWETFKVDRTARTEAWCYGMTRLVQEQHQEQRVDQNVRAEGGMGHDREQWSHHGGPSGLDICPQLEGSWAHASWGPKGFYSIGIPL